MKDKKEKPVAGQPLTDEELARAAGGEDNEGSIPSVRQCPICGKGFLTVKDAADHMITHVSVNYGK